MSKDLAVPIDANTIRQVTTEYGTPVFIYSLQSMDERAQQLMKLEAPYGLVVRYAVKANSHAKIIERFDALGLHFDASSGYEAAGLLEQDIPGNKISLSSQEPAHNLAELVAAGVQFVAASMHQLELFAKLGKQTSVALRVNPGIGTGHNNRTSTGGLGSSFGLWHEYVPQALQMAAQQRLVIDRLHIHVGSGGDVEQWGKVIDSALAIAADMPTVKTLDIGGGYKISRASNETEADMTKIVGIFVDKLREFATKTGRELKLEVEPGTWLVGHAGVLVAEVVDIVDTGKDGYTFIKLNTGMNDLLRPSQYGAQHGITVLNDSSTRQDYVVVGHNCETGDILTPYPGDPERLLPKKLNQANIGDLVIIHDVGAYAASMSAHGYNAFPDAKEVVLTAGR